MIDPETIHAERAEAEESCQEPQPSTSSIPKPTSATSVESYGDLTSADAPESPDTEEDTGADTHSAMLAGVPEGVEVPRDPWKKPVRPEDLPYENLAPGEKPVPPRPYRQLNTREKNAYLRARRRWKRTAYRDTYEKLAAYVKHLRNRFGWTQVQLAKRLGVSERTVSRWETMNEYPGIAQRNSLIELEKAADKLAKRAR